jgi:hypothetical protein
MASSAAHSNHKMLRIGLTPQHGGGGYMSIASSASRYHLALFAFGAAMRCMTAFTASFRCELVVLGKAALARAYALTTFPACFCRKTGVL